MKRLFTLTLLTVLFTTYTQITEAQTITSINQSSLSISKKLKSTLQIKNKERKKIRRAYTEYYSRLASLNSLTGSSSGNNFGNKEHLLKIRLQKTVKKALKNDEVLFDKYLVETNQEDFTNLVEKVKNTKVVRLTDNNSSKSPQKRSTPTVNLKIK